MARARLSSAEKGAIEQAMQDGWISTNTAAKMLEEADLRLTEGDATSRGIAFTQQHLTCAELVASEQT